MWFKKSSFEINVKKAFKFFNESLPKEKRNDEKFIETQSNKLYILSRKCILQDIKKYGKSYGSFYNFDIRYDLFQDQINQNVVNRIKNDGIILHYNNRLDIYEWDMDDDLKNKILEEDHDDN